MKKLYGIKLDNMMQNTYNSKYPKNKKDRNDGI